MELLGFFDSLAASGTLEIVLTCAGVPALAAGVAGYRKYRNAQKSRTN